MSEWTPEARADYARAYICSDIREAQSSIRAALEQLPKARLPGDERMKVDLEEVAHRLKRLLDLAEAARDL